MLRQVSPAIEEKMTWEEVSTLCSVLCRLSDPDSFGLGLTVVTCSGQLVR